MNDEAMRVVINGEEISLYDEFQKRETNVQSKIPQTDLFILGDEVACERVIENILLNVIQHGKETVEINLREKGDFIHLIVTNKMDRLNIKADQVFDRFYTADESRRYSGGLGLSIVQNLIEALSGKVEVNVQRNSFEVLCIWKRLSS